MQAAHAAVQPAAAPCSQVGDALFPNVQCLAASPDTLPPAQSPTCLLMVHANHVSLQSVPHDLSSGMQGLETSHVYTVLLVQAQIAAASPVTQARQITRSADPEAETYQISPYRYQPHVITHGHQLLTDKTNMHHVFATAICTNSMSHTASFQVAVVYCKTDMLCSISWNAARRSEMQDL